VSTAGCSGIFGDQTPTRESPGASTASPVDQEAERDAGSTTYTDDLSTNRIVISLSEVPSEVAFDGETRQFRSEVDNQEQQELAQQGILLLHKRTFRKASESLETSIPDIILSAAVVYENATIAEREFDSTIETMESNGANVTERTLTSVSLTQVQFKNERGFQNTILYYRDSNLLMYVITTGETEYYETMTEEYLLEMLAELNRGN
jgi:hypothetical protein